MARKKLGILSSYGVTCGNASYTHVLKEEFSKHYDVDIIPLNFQLLTNAHPSVSGKIQNYLRDLCATLAQYDFINIQFEAALFGHSMENACNNAIQILDAARNLSFTIHRLHNPSFAQPLWKTCLKNRFNIMKTLQAYNQVRQYKAFARLMSALNARLDKKLPTVTLVHTMREKEFLQTYYGVTAVIDFPITFLTRGQIADHEKGRASIREQLCARYALDPALKYIGIFGFLAANKAHHVAMDVLRFLPSDYRLLIFGAQHPMSIKDYDLGGMMKNPKSFLSNNDAYVSSLVDLAKDINSCQMDRIRFMGSLEDPEFIDALTAMDYVLVPYYETGQSGSGNASLVLEVGAKAIFSRNHAFIELGRYYKDCFAFADIGNSVEIAQRIKYWGQDYSANIRTYTAKYNIENNILIQKKCFEEGLSAAERLKTELVN